MRRMPILVPVVASYPLKRSVMANYRKCKAMGYEVVLDPALRGKPPKTNGRLTDVEYRTPLSRARALGQMMEKHAHHPMLIATATGGIGTIRMMAHWYKYSEVFKNSTVVGFSDSTALAIKAATKSEGMPSFHGPCFEDKEFVDALPFYQHFNNRWRTKIEFKSGVTLKEYVGKVWGGNLTLFGYTLANPGVRQAINDTINPILFFEDIYEDALYKGANKRFLFEMELDRLEYAGMFRRAQMVLLGRISEIKRNLVIQSLKKYFKGPIIGLDIGHDDGKRKAKLMPVIPLGVRVKFTVSGDLLSCIWKTPGRIVE